MVQGPTAWMMQATHTIGPQSDPHCLDCIAYAVSWVIEEYRHQSLGEFGYWFDPADPGTCESDKTSLCDGEKQGSPRPAWDPSTAETRQPQRSLKRENTAVYPGI